LAKNRNFDQKSIWSKIKSLVGFDTPVGSKYCFANISGEGISCRNTGFGSGRKLSKNGEYFPNWKKKFRFW